MAVSADRAAEERDAPRPAAGRERTHAAPLHPCCPSLTGIRGSESHGFRNTTPDTSAREESHASRTNTSVASWDVREPACRPSSQGCEEAGVSPVGPLRHRLPHLPEKSLHAQGRLARSGLREWRHPPTGVARPHTPVHGGPHPAAGVEEKASPALTATSLPAAWLEPHPGFPEFLISRCATPGGQQHQRGVCRP